jgi:heterodisulfide reductase subunit A-like polyferredoxin
MIFPNFPLLEKKENIDFTNRAMANSSFKSKEAEQKPQFHALIVGCGLSGLASALALGKAGHRVTVFERSVKLQEVRANTSSPVLLFRCKETYVSALYLRSSPSKF